MIEGITILIGSILMLLGLAGSILPILPVPPLAIQRKIVGELEAERRMVEANRKLIDIFERKIQSKLAEIWGEENS